MKELRIAVISGGESAEAEVSRSSARGVIAALRDNHRDVTEIELDSQLPQRLLELAPDVVFPVLHGPPGEDGTVQGLLEMLDLAYVGSDVHGSAVAMDKIAAKGLFRAAGLPTARDTVIAAEAPVAASVDRVLARLGNQVVVKPSRQGSAIGVTLVANDNELHEALKGAAQYGGQTLIEERISGREITVGVLETDAGPQVFPVIEIVTPSDAWYDYEHRYTKGLSQHVMPAELSATQSARLQQIALDAHQVLGCRDLSRADFVVSDETREVLLEVNTLPGMTPTSLFPEGAAAIGFDFPALVSHLVTRAAARH